MLNPQSSCFSTRDCRRSPRSFVFRSTVRIASSLAAFSTLLSPVAALAQTSAYVQKNIISDGSVPAEKTDPTLINPWGVSIGPDFWINTAGTGFSLVEDASGNKSFAVTIPPASSAEPHGVPAGTVFNSDTSIFNIPGNGPANFLFGNLDGSIAAWNTSTPQAVTVVNNSSAKASYTDIAVAKNTTGTFLLAANFASGTVDVFDSNFAPAHLAGNFSDPNLPSGYSPFGIHAIGSNVYVTYAQINDQGRENVGAGLGYVDVFDLNGNFVQRAISQGGLNAPWGMALAPSGFGSLGGSLLVANFGDGVINAYDPTSFALKGQITDATGAPIANPGLWEIVFGVGNTIGTPATAGDPNTLYFAAGINNETGGLFGSIAVAAPATAGDFPVTPSASNVTVTNGQVGNLSLSVAGNNGFSGTVTFACSGLPAGATCTFNPASVNVSGTTASMASVSIATGAATTPTPAPAPAPTPAPPANPYTANLRHHRQALWAGILPLGLLSFVGFRKRLGSLRGSVLALLCILTLGSMSGCSSGTSATPTASTPAPTSPAPTPITSQITLTATSGSLSHSVSVNLTMN
jgi:uncharacterized protein (TIGR03118 family)